MTPNRCCQRRLTPIYCRLANHEGEELEDVYRYRFRCEQRNGLQAHYLPFYSATLCTGSVNCLRSLICSHMFKDAVPFRALLEQTKNSRNLGGRGIEIFWQI